MGRLANLHDAIQARLDRLAGCRYTATGMDALVEELNAKLESWQPQTCAEVRFRVAEIIALADEDALDLGRSRMRDQEVLDLLDDEPAPR